MAHDSHAEHASADALHAEHASADAEYVNPATGAGHEHTDANVSMIIQFAIWLAVSAVATHVLVWFMFAVFVDTRQNPGPAEFPLAIDQGPRLPAGPRLQAQPANEIYDFRRREAAMVDGYSWVDRGAGTVRIPITEAMRLTVEKGLPTRPSDGATVAPPIEASSLMPADASAGRTMEQRR